MEGSNGNKQRGMAVDNFDLCFSDRILVGKMVEINLTTAST